MSTKKLNKKHTFRNNLYKKYGKNTRKPLNKRKKTLKKLFHRQIHGGIDKISVIFVRPVDENWLKLYDITILPENFKNFSVNKSIINIVRNQIIILYKLSLLINKRDALGKIKKSELNPLIKDITTHCIDTILKLYPNLKKSVSPNETVFLSDFIKNISTVNETDYRKQLVLYVQFCMFMNSIKNDNSNDVYFPEIIMGFFNYIEESLNNGEGLLQYQYTKTDKQQIGILSGELDDENADLLDRNTFSGMDNRNTFSGMDNRDTFSGSSVETVSSIELSSLSLLHILASEQHMTHIGIGKASKFLSFVSSTSISMPKSIIETVCHNLFFIVFVMIKHYKHKDEFIGIINSILNTTIKKIKIDTKTKSLTENGGYILNNVLKEMNKMNNDSISGQYNCFLDTFKLLNDNSSNMVSGISFADICSDDNKCIGFGIKTSEIKPLFNNFQDNTLITKSKILSNGINGQVTLLTYRNKGKGLTTYAVLKQSLEEDSDNLMYEFLVGMFINKQTPKFPCFVETYNVEADYKENNVTKRQIHHSYETISDKHMFSVCQYSSNIKLLTQFFSNAHTLFDTLAEKHIKNDNSFIENNLMYILYQIFMPLSCIANDFTHYDLHSNNVLLYIPKENHYITYNYILSGNRSCKFHSKYMCKIIDYGRSYFNDSANNSTFTGSSSEIRNFLEKKKCPRGKGFGFVTDCESDDKNTDIEKQKSGFTCSNTENMSHDLLLLCTLKQFIKPTSNLYNIFDKLTYEQGFTSVKKSFCFGTKLNTENNGRINTVIDAHNALFNLISQDDNIAENELLHGNLTKLGDLFIYDDGRPMEYKDAINGM